MGEKMRPVANRDSYINGDDQMAGTVEQKLATQGIVLHQPRSPIANYVGFVRTGNLLFVSGQVCLDADGKLIAKGKLGADVTVEQGYAAAQGCASTCWRRSRPRSAISTRWPASSASAASSIRRRTSSTGPRC